MRRDHVIALVLVLAAVAASVAIAVVALDLAAGVTRPRGRCCRTEFIDGQTLRLLWLPILLLAVAAGWSWRLALAGALAVAVPQWLAMNEVMDRYARSGWGDGLEVLGYLLPIQTAVFGAISVTVGALVGARLRRVRPSAAGTSHRR